MPTPKNIENIEDENIQNPGSKKARDFSGQDLKREAQQALRKDTKKNVLNGVAGGRLEEGIPNFIVAPCESVRSGDNNSHIVLGRDRPSDRLSGYGGKGDTQAGMIDLVVGRGDTQKPQSVDPASGRPVYVNNDFFHDSARIYISQKTDIDENFALADGSLGNQKTKSGIGIKADAVRIIGRDGIKLVTRTDLKNSMGVPAREDIGGIDLIAGNDSSKLEPLVKGDSLISAINEIIRHINDLNGIVDGMLMIQHDFNETLQSHWHFSPFFGAPTSASPTAEMQGMQCGINHLTKTKSDLYNHKKNLNGFKFNFLKKSGKKYICSRYNNVN
tara:strand:+ start:1219 stop:2208 length:990 start_codon:yes stop_codon:yes gene_type:complete